MALQLAPELLNRERSPHQLLERYHRDRSPADRALLVERFLPLARHLAHRYRTHSDREDVEQVAALGLVKAIERFDPHRGIAFTSFAVPTIIGEIKRYFRDLGWAVRVPRELQELAAKLDGANDRLTSRLGRQPTIAELAEACGTTVERVLDARGTVTAHFADSLDAPARDDEADAPPNELRHEDAGFARAEERADIDGLLSVLEAREREIVRMRFFEDLTQREIADRVGLSQMQVSRVLRRAMTELQAHAVRNRTASDRRALAAG